MRIGIFVDEYHPKVSGVITSTANFKRALEELGHTVYVITVTEPGYSDSEPNIIRLPSFDPIVFKKQHDGRLPLTYPGIAKKLAHYQFDIVHSQTEFSMGILAHEVAKKLNVPHIGSAHTIYAEMAGQYGFMVYSGLVIASIVYPIYFKAMPKMKFDLKGSKDALKKQIWTLATIFFNNTDGVITPSRHLADKLVRFGLTKPHYLIPNGVDVASLRAYAAEKLPTGLVKNEGDLWLISVARISGEKRPEALIEALSKVGSDRVKLVMVGDGPGRESAETLVDRLGLRERVIFTGSLSQSKMAAVLGHSDMFALVSYNFDNQPVTILEAAAVGLPIIYCDPNIREGLSPETAILAASPSPADIAAAISELAANPARRQDMSAKARELIEQGFDIRELALKLADIYEQTIRAHQSQA